MADINNIPTKDFCPTCEKPYVFIGEIPTYGFRPGKEPWCTCGKEEQVPIIKPQNQ